MKKIISFIVLVLCFNSSFSQMYVSPNTYVFDKGEVVYIKGNLELNAATSNFYLRNEAQLLQGTTSTSTNKGAGKLSVFQEGTSNGYSYNYWCSPIGNASATVGNENFGITMLNRPTSVTASSPAVILAMNGYNGIASSLSIAPYWIWKYLNSDQYALNAGGWISVFSASTIAPGEGFTMKGTDGTDATNVGEIATNNPGSAQRYDFRGKPNDGNITVGVATNKNTLTGNPYPSALNVNKFLLDSGNTACDGAAYYWEQNKSVNSHIVGVFSGGYGTYSPISLASGGIYTPAVYNTYNADGSVNTIGASSGLSSIQRKYAPIGQGFMLLGTSNGNVTIKNSHREYYKESANVNAHFERDSNYFTNDTPPDDGPINSVSHIRVNTVFNNQYTSQLALVFLPEATDGVDRGVDAKSPIEETDPLQVYFALDNNKYVIQGINFDVNKRVKLGVKATNPNTIFEFSLFEEVDFDVNQDVFIYDALDNSYHNIKNGPYSATLQPGEDTNRFEITFTESALSTNVNAIENLSVIQNNPNQMLTVLNPNIMDLKSVVLYDVNGKQIFNKLNLGSKSSYEFSTSSLSEGIYLVKLTASNNQTFSNKIIVRRNN